MTKFFSLSLIAATALLPTSAFAEKPIASSFKYAGEEYVYTSTSHGGATYISGYVKNDSAPFQLKVDHGYVTGTVNDSPVAFSVSEVQKLAVISADEVAVR